MIKIRLFEKSDWDGLWNIIKPVMRSGETYVYPPDISEEEAYNVWIEIPSDTYVAINPENVIQGTYYIKPNQPGLGNHICNCGYIVDETSRGQGIASEMCIHSQKIAIKKGFRAMQYNFVVSTNIGAIRLWKRHGFEIIGTIPKAYRHQKLGFIDAVIMYKGLK